jgi:hypothetical protein
MTVDLLPNPRLVLRTCLFAGLVVFGLIGSAPWWNKLLWIAGMAMLCGTYRMARLQDGDFQRRMVWGFVPRPWRTWPLENFVEIELFYESPFNIQQIWPVALFNLCWLPMFWVFDWLFPFFGGSYKVRLRPKKGARVVVWQGNSQANFEANIEILQTATGLKSVRKK